MWPVSNSKSTCVSVFTGQRAQAQESPLRLNGEDIEHIFFKHISV